MSRLSTALLALLTSLAVLVGCSGEADPPAPGSTERSRAEGTSGGTEASTDTPTDPTDASPPSAPAAPNSVLGLAAVELPGSDLRVGAVRERTDAFTSYDVTFSSTRNGRGTGPLTISGVLNVPNGRGPHPAVVLAHGYIEPSIYVRGQGMTRERGYLAERGYVALHVDYRNHAESGQDDRPEASVRMGYSTDVIAAAEALISSSEVRVDPDRIALFGRSMGGGVMMKALEIAPELFAAGVGWASVSSLEAENFEHFRAPDGPLEQMRRQFAGRHGLPDEEPDFWRGISARPFFDLITVPVLMVHGRNDSTCPPRWATATDRAMRRAGVDATLEWYDDEHAFGPTFNAAMDRTVRFLDTAMP